MKGGKRVLGSLLIFAALSLTAAAQPGTIAGKVVSVADGDTITVLDSSLQQHKIRFDGIDAPESSQDFGSRSKQSLSDLVFGKNVIVYTSKKDKYGRNVGKVTLDGRDINLEQINRGMAWFYREYAKELNPQDAKLYEQAEANAKSAKRGLWVDPNPMPPWEFRHGKAGGSPGANPNAPGTASEPIIGNRNSKVYHLPNCPDYNKVSERNRVPFKSAGEAEAAGYRKARNCP
jgi:endonuclease YncB( thermonuclease family)